jgi:hypothetical protein
MLRRREAHGDDVPVFPAAGSKRPGLTPDPAATSEPEEGGRKLGEVVTWSASCAAVLE